MKGIAKRVTIGFLSLVILLLVAGLISLFELGHMGNEAKIVLDQASANMDIARNLLGTANEHSNTVIHFSVFGEKSYRKEHKSLIDSMRKELRTVNNRIVSHSTIDSILLRIDDLEKITDEYIVRLEKQDSLYTASEVDHLKIEELNIDGQMWYDYVYEDKLDNLVSKILDYMSETYTILGPRAEQISNNAYRAVAPVFTAQVVMIAIVFMFFFFVMVYIVKPILRINKSVKDYLSFKLPYKPSCEKIDEIESLDKGIESLVNIAKNKDK